MQLYILQYSDCWAEGYDILGIFDSYNLAADWRTSIANRPSSYMAANKENYRIVTMLMNQAHDICGAEI